MRAFVVSPPQPAVSLADAKKHLKVSHGAEDELIAGMVAAATGHIDGPDGWLGRALAPQTLEARFDAFETAGRVRLPYGPIINLVAIEYLGVDGEPRQADPEDVELLGSELVAAGSALPWEGCSLRREAIRVQYLAGYEDGIPAPIRAAILLMTGDLYRNRETTTTGGTTVSKVPMSTTVENLLAPFRIFA